MIHTAIVEFIKAQTTSTEAVYWGKLPKAADLGSGAINIFQLPSPFEVNQQQALRIQANVHALTRYEAHVLADELMAALVHFRGGIADGEGITYYGHFAEISDGGELEEETSVEDKADTVIMIPVYFSWVHIKGF
jgi:hypothetical protein